MNEELNRIDALLTDEYNDGDVPPSVKIVEEAKSILRKAFESLGERMPKANFITPDLDGGLRIQYQRGKKHVRLIVTPKQTFTYWQDEDDFGFGNVFVSKLVWLMG